MRNFVIAADWLWGVESVLKGREMLANGCCALDAVEGAIRVVEDDPNVKSVGTGGLPNARGILELDASIMDGTSLKAGAVTCLTRTRNPISVARKVMELTPHVLLAGQGATEFARSCGFPEYDPMTAESRATWKKLHEAIFSTDEPTEQTYRDLVGYSMDVGRLTKSLRSVLGTYSSGTVGVVARDQHGNIAAGTSTSGWPMRFPGRVADSSIIGAGTYANAKAGASATGSGEIAMRHCLAKNVCDLVQEGLSPSEACETALIKILSREESDQLLGVICVDIDCNVGGACTLPDFQFEYMASSDRDPRIVKPKPVQ